MKLSEPKDGDLRINNKSPYWLSPAGAFSFKVMKVTSQQDITLPSRALLTMFCERFLKTK